RFGMPGSRTRERPGDVRPAGGIDLQPGQGFGVVDFASLHMPEFVILIKNLIHQAQAIRWTSPGDWSRKAGPMDDPGAGKGGLVAKDVDIVLRQPGIPEPLAIGAVEGSRRRIDLRRTRQEGEHTTEAAGQGQTGGQDEVARVPQVEASPRVVEDLIAGGKPVLPARLGIKAYSQSVEER